MKRRAAAVLALCLTALVAPTAASNAAAPAWKGPTALPTGSDASGIGQSVPDPAGGALLYYNRNGVPTLSRVSASGSLGAPAQIPVVTSLGNFGTPGNIVFLANGGAIVTWILTTYGPYMAYRSPSGTFGKPVAVSSGISSVAVRTGEVLTIGPGGTGMSAESWTLKSNGTITAKSGPTSVYTGQPLFSQSWLALDSAGSAEVIVLGSIDNGDTESVTAAVRTAKGVWKPQTQVSHAGAFVTKLAFATAPGGRAILTWIEAPTNVAATSYTEVRPAGKPFGAATNTGAVASSDGAFLYPGAAAGPDGTLATSISQKTFTGAAPQTSTVVRITAPKASQVGNGHTVPGSDKTFNVALGAGHGEAIVGMHGETITDAGVAFPSSYHESQTTSAAIISPTGSSITKTLGSSSGLYDGNGGDGCGCATSPPHASVMGVSLDGAGLAVAIGQLTPGDVLKYAVRAGSATAKPKITVSSKHAAATSSKIPVKLACAKAACKGTLTLTAKVGKKATRLASSSYSIAAGKHKTIKAKLTKAGKKALKGAKKHHVHATLVVTVKGGSKVTAHVTVS